MRKLTKKQALVIMGYTGITTINFSEFHEDVERRLKRPIMTHSFPKYSKEIKEEYKKDFLKICIMVEEEWG